MSRLRHWRRDRKRHMSKDALARRRETAYNSNKYHSPVHSRILLEQFQLALHRKKIGRKYDAEYVMKLRGNLVEAKHLLYFCNG
eukprot:6669988-Prymnesium_polylepis.1